MSAVGHFRSPLQQELARGAVLCQPDGAIEGLESFGHAPGAMQQMRASGPVRLVGLRCRRVDAIQRANSLLGAFGFRNRRGTAVKVLTYDGQGFWLCHKRLSQGRFPWWPSAPEKGAGRLAAHQLAVLLSAGDPTRTGAAADWRPVGPLV